MTGTILRRLYFVLVALFLAAPIIVVLGVSVNEKQDLAFPPVGFSLDWYGQIFLDEGWRTAMQVNVAEPASLIREAVRHFLGHGGGTLIALSSWAAQRGSAISNLNAYAASKAAIANLTQTVARNYAKYSNTGGQYDDVAAFLKANGL